MCVLEFACSRENMFPIQDKYIEQLSILKWRNISETSGTQTFQLFAHKPLPNRPRFNVHARSALTSSWYARARVWSLRRHHVASCRMVPVGVMMTLRWAAHNMRCVREGRNKPTNDATNKRTKQRFSRCTNKRTNTGNGHPSCSLPNILPARYVQGPCPSLNLSSCRSTLRTWRVGQVGNNTEETNTPMWFNWKYNNFETSTWGAQSR